MHDRGTGGNAVHGWMEIKDEEVKMMRDSEWEGREIGGGREERLMNGEERV